MEKTAGKLRFLNRISHEHFVKQLFLNVFKNRLKMKDVTCC